MPFEIPKSWEWINIEDLAIDMADGPFGSNLKASHYTNNREVRIIQLSNIGEEGWREENTKYTTFKHLKEISRSEVTPGDIIIAKMMPAGRAIICPNHEPAYVLSSDAVKLRPSKHINVRYLLYAINSPMFQQQVHDNVQGVTRLRTSIAKLKGYFIPLPPLSEQSKIVESIEQYIILIDSVGLDSLELQKHIEKCKTKILDYAIRGKLVPQDPKDEPAIELLKRIAPEFQPCDTSHYENIPQNWCVCKFKDIFEITMGSSPTGDSLNRLKEGVEFHQGKICFTDKYLSKSDIYTNSLTKLGKKYSILLCVRAPVGLVNITERDICIGRGLCALYPKQCLDLMFAFYALQTYQDYFDEKATGSTFKAIGSDTIREAEFSLPPYNEQKRIRKALESIFANMDEICKEL